MDDAAKWERRFDRERRAREEAEALLEDRSRALYLKTIELDTLASHLQDDVAAKTAELMEINGRLRTENARFSSMAANVPGVIYQFHREADGSEGLSYISPAVKELLGVEAEDLMRDFSVFKVHPEDVERFRESIKQCLTRMDQLNEEVRVVRPDGEVRWIKFTSLPQREGDRIVSHGLMVDVTAEVAREEQVRMLSEVASRTDNGVVITDPQGITIWANEGFSAISGFPLAELVGKSPGALLQGEKTDPAAVERIRSALRESSSFHVEILNYRKTGEAYWVEIQGNPIFDKLGRLEYFIAIQKDITGRRHDAQRLQDSERRFRDIADAAGEYIWECDNEGRFTYVSMRAEKVLGLPHEEIIGQHAAAFAPPLERKRISRLIRLAMTRPMIFRNEQVPGVRGDGSLFWQRISGLPSFDHRGGFRGYRGTAQDVTAEIETLEQLQDQKDFAETVMRSMGQGMIVSDSAGKTEFVNQQFLELIEYPLDEALRMTFVDWTLPGDQERFRIAAEDRRAGKFSTFEVRLINSRGEEIEVLLTGRPLIRNGTIEGSITVVTDLRRRLQMERSLRDANHEAVSLNERLQIEIDRANELAREADQANRAKGIFLTTMSHEIRTPLNGLIGMLRLLHGSSLQSSEQLYVQLARNSADALLAVINDILDFSKIEAGKMELELVGFDFRRTVEAIFDFLRFKAVGKGLGFAGVIDHRLPMRVRGDPTRLRQVLLNLGDNAIKFTAEGSVGIEVLATAEGPGQGIHFRVTDTGVGIEAKYLEQLFDSFTQGDASTTRRFGGTGLGLAISQALVELMGGVLKVESDFGRGSCFFFDLPLEAAPEPGAEPPQVIPAHQRKGWVIAGEAMQTRMVMEALLWAGFDPVAVLEEAPVDFSGSDQWPSWSVVLVGSCSLPVPFAALEAERAQRPPMVLVAVGERPELSASLRQTLDRAEALRPLTPAGGPQVVQVLLQQLDGQTDSVEANRPEPEDDLFLANCHVLVAEDNPVNQIVIQAELQRAGASFEIAGNGFEVLRAVSQRRFDLILMDIRMPEMDGVEACRRLRELDHQIPIIALTANVMKSDVETYLAAGMNGYLSKPFEREGLRAEVLRLKSPETLKDEPPVSPAADSVESIDPGEIIALFGANRDLATGVVQQFLVQSAEQFVALGRALEAGNREAMEELFHSLAGSSASLRCRSLAEVCRQGEGALRAAESLEAVSLWLDQARRCYALLEAQLREAFGAGSAPSAES